MWQYNYTKSSDELYHYGVLGMKWGVSKRQQKKTKQLIEKELGYRGKAYEESKLNNYTKQLSEHKKMGVKKWVKDVAGSGLEGEDPKIQKQFYDEETDWYNDKILSGKAALKYVDAYEKKIRAIDPSSMSYKSAKKLVRSITNDYTNDVAIEWENLWKKQIDRN